jgi:hypothetical protein
MTVRENMSPCAQPVGINGIMKDILRYRWTIMLFVVIAFIGCKESENSNIIVDMFPEVDTLTGSPVSEIEIFEEGIEICVVDSFLIILQRQSAKIKIYSTNTHKLLTEFGSKGRGPGEFIAPTFTGQTEYGPEDKNPVVYIFDLERHRLTFADIVACLKNPQHTNKTISVPREVNLFFSRFYYKNDSMFFALPESGGRFLFYNYRTSVIKMIPYVPDIGLKLGEDYLRPVYYSSCCVNKSKKLIAAAPLGIGEIDFFDLNGNYIKSTIFKPRENLKKDLTPTDIRYYITSLISDEDLIYGLNCNNTNSDLYKTKKISSFKIEVFSWDGQPVKEYILDQRFVSSFAIDHLHKRVYGFCPYEPENKIFIYDLEK